MRAFQLLYEGSILGGCLSVFFLERATGIWRLLLVALMPLSAAVCGVSCLLYRKLPVDEKKNIQESGTSILSVHPYITFAVLACSSVYLIALFCFPSFMNTAFSSVLYLPLILLGIAAFVVKFRGHQAGTRKQEPPIVHKKRRNKHK